MLERATACLKSGVTRDSLRAASSHAPRTRRLLHSSFWTHGAGDLDLPAILLPLTASQPRSATPGDSRATHHYRRRRGGQRGKNGVVDEQDAAWTSEGPFLDFLYPPQALAWLQRSSSNIPQSQTHYWDSRNVRRLPEGFVVAARGYASSSRNDHGSREGGEDGFERTAERREKSQDGKDASKQGMSRNTEGAGQQETVSEKVESATPPGPSNTREDESPRGPTTEPSQDSGYAAFEPFGGSPFRKVYPSHEKSASLEKLYQQSMGDENLDARADSLDARGRRSTMPRRVSRAEPDAFRRSRPPRAWSELQNPPHTVQHVRNDERPQELEGGSKAGDPGSDATLQAKGQISQRFRPSVPSESDRESQAGDPGADDSLSPERVRFQPFGTNVPFWSDPDSEARAQEGLSWEYQSYGAMVGNSSQGFRDPTRRAPSQRGGKGEVYGWLASDEPLDERHAPGRNNPFEAPSGSREASPDSFYVPPVATEPADITDETPSGGRPQIFVPEAIDDPFEYLQTVVRSTRNRVQRVGMAQSRKFTDHVWTVFDTMDPELKEDLRLRKELLVWMSRQGNNLSQIRTLELHHSIPAASRDLQTYSCTASVLIAMGGYDEAFVLHKEALRTIENGHEISRMLMRHALERRIWLFASDIAAEHAEYYRGASRSNEIDIFWLHVGDTPDLFKEAVHLRFAMETASPEFETVEFKEFSARLFKEAIAWEYLTSSDQHPPTKFTVIGDTGEREEIDLPSRSIHYMFDTVCQAQPDCAEMIEAVLFAILRPDSKFDYDEQHIVASYIWQHCYIEKDGVSPSEDLLMAFLRNLTSHFARHADQPASARSVFYLNIADEWRKRYPKIRLDGILHVLAFCAREAEPMQFDDYWKHFLFHYESWEDRKEGLWTSVVRHAYTGDLEAAQQAFAQAKRLASESGQEVDVRCWNALLDAHGAADDFEGAITNIRNMVEGAKLTPNMQTFQPIADMLAKRGDVGATRDLLAQAGRLSSAKLNADLYHALMDAHIRCDDIEGAENLLLDLIPRIRNGEVEGSLTLLANKILSLHAYRRDMPSLLRTYHAMQDERIILDADSYAALMQCLVGQRRADAAWGILRYVLPRKGIKATALHYSLCMVGYSEIERYGQGRTVARVMRERNVAPSPASHAALLGVKAGLEGRELDELQPDGPAPPLEETTKALSELLQDSGKGRRTTRLSGLPEGYGTMDDAVPGAYFEVLIRSHGVRQCLDAVQQLYAEFMKSSGRLERGEPPPMRLLAALMLAFNRAGEYENVEACWQIAKEAADDVVKPVSMPTLKSTTKSGPGSQDANSIDALQLTNELSKSPKISASAGKDRPSAATQQSAADGGPSQDQAQSPPTDDPSPAPRSVPAGLSRILDDALHQYILALNAQQRLTDEIAVFVGVLRQGYNVTLRPWNDFIRHLCSHSPPLALLAFVLTEQFLIGNFPGWTWRRVRWIQHLKPNELRWGVEHLQHWFLTAQDVFPQYSTLVFLGSVLLDLRHMEASGAPPTHESLQPYIGSLRAIRERAPRTMYVVQSMPDVADEIQERVLRRNLESR